MRIAIPVDNGRLAGHFGRCRQVMMFTVELADRHIHREDVMNMPAHQPGVFPSWLREHGADVVIAGGMGPKALNLLAQAGIRVVLGATTSDPRQLAVDFLNDRLDQGVNTCAHDADHRCEH